jgi:succinate-semialdehyde dehydrogenase/glutarate-semialdehyde dehydrogenase
MQGLQDSALFRQANYINGVWQEFNPAGAIPVINPYDQALLGYVPNATAIDVAHAIEAANTAWQSWRCYSADERSSYLSVWANLIDQHKEDLARIMTLEQGKPLQESRAEIDYANRFIKWFAEEARRVYGDIIPSNKRNQHLLVIKQPVGVVAAITPWNFPAAMITRKIAPALAAGCTVVLKPSEETPFSALALAVLAERAGLPKGGLNVITGDAEMIGTEMTANPLIRKLSFTGSTRVGRLLMQQSASTIKKLSLELGGNAPFIVFADADIDAAVAGALLSKYRNSGQTCVCANRIFVEDKIYTEFSERFVQAVKKLKVGNGLDESVQQGPLINPKALQKVQQHIADALAQGGHLLLGGHVIEGLLFEPTVIANANINMLLAKEETFGPLAPLFRFSTEQEVIQLANETDAGLAAYFYSRDLDRVWRVAEALEYGMVGVNTGLISTEVAPFGGVKQSGIGREGSKYGIDDYLELKYICMGSGLR